MARRMWVRGIQVALLSVCGVCTATLAHNGAVAIAVPVAGITVDGDLSDWPEKMQRYPVLQPEDGQRPRDRADLSGAFRAGYNAQENALYVAVEVLDESTVTDTTGAPEWTALDGCSLSLDLLHDELESPVVACIIWGTARRIWGGVEPPVRIVKEITIGGVRWKGSEVRSPDVTGRGFLAAEQRQLAGRYFYEWRVDVGRLTEGRTNLAPGMSLGLGVTAADKDTDGSSSRVSWALDWPESGAPAGLGDLLLAGSSVDLGEISGVVMHSGSRDAWPRVRVNARTMGSPMWVRAVTDGAGRFRLPLVAGTYAVAVEGGHGAEPARYHLGEGERIAGVALVPRSVRSIGRLPRLAWDTATELRLTGHAWRYQLGDSMAWAQPETDDDLWPVVPNTFLEITEGSQREVQLGVLPADGWRGVCWFRTRLAVARQLRHTSVLLDLPYQPGAAEVFLDGESVYAAGRIGLSAADESVTGERLAQTIDLGDEPEHVLAVRYSNFTVPAQQYGGFLLRLQEPKAGMTAMARDAGEHARTQGQQAMLTAIPAVISLLHLVLYLFYRRVRENLYYAAFALFLAVTVYGVLELDLAPRFSPGGAYTAAMLGDSDPQMMGDYSHSSQALALTMARALLALRESLTSALAAALMALPVSGLLLLYALFHPSVPRRFWAFAGAFGVGLALSSGLLGPLSTGHDPLFSVLFVLAAVTHMSWPSGTTLATAATILWFVLTVPLYLEMLRVVATAVVRRREGAWLVGLGFVGFFALLTAGGKPVSASLPIALMSPVVGVSVFMARRTARTSRDLETQLVRVQELSAKTVDQERALREEAEKELRTAHELQMGLLPRTSPAVEGCSSAGRCLPAAQVGGDLFQYYHSQGRLSVALADVTGHAMQAAIPAVMFSGILDSQMRTGGELRAVFGRLNEVLCEKLTGRTHVTLAMAELEVRTGLLRFANAGCPYPCHWRQATGEVVELSLDAYPLGVKQGALYRTVETRLAPGDYLVFCSDGIAEAQDPAGELFGFERTVEAVRDACSRGLSPDGVIDHLVAAVRDFCGETAQGDDITCVVVRREG